MQLYLRELPRQATIATKAFGRVWQAAIQRLTLEVTTAWWLVVLLGLPTLTVGWAVLLGDGLRPVDATSLIVSPATLLLVNLAVTNLWKETGWTGYSRPPRGTTPSPTRRPHHPIMPTGMRAHSALSEVQTRHQVRSAGAPQQLWARWKRRLCRRPERRQPQRPGPRR